MSTTLCLGITADKIRQVLWLHKRLGHPSRDTMVQAIKNQTWVGVPDDLTPPSNAQLANFPSLTGSHVVKAPVFILSSPFKILY